MCVVIDVNGEEINVPDVVSDEIYLDSDNVRRTVNFLIEEKKKWATNWKMKKEERKENRTFKKKMIKLLIG